MPSISANAMSNSSPPNPTMSTSRLLVRIAVGPAKVMMASSFGYPSYRRNMPARGNGSHYCSFTRRNTPAAVEGASGQTRRGLSLPVFAVGNCAVSTAVEEQAVEQHHQHDQADNDIGAVALEGECHNGKRDPGDWGRDQQQQAELDQAGIVPIERAPDHAPDGAQTGRFTAKDAIIQRLTPGMSKVPDGSGQD